MLRIGTNLPERSWTLMTLIVGERKPTGAPFNGTGSGQHLLQLILPSSSFFSTGSRPQRLWVQPTVAV